MKKEWFIFKGTHHLGPFSLKEMEDFFHTGEINAQSLVWREGAEKWEALSKTRELLFLIQDPNKKPELPNVKADLPGLPDLPELPDDMPPPAPKALAAKVAPMPLIEDDEPPPIPLDAILNPTGRKEIFQEKSSSARSNAPKFIFASLVALFVVVLGWFYMNERTSSIQIRIKGMMPVYVEKLQEVATQKTPSLSMTMALSLDGKTLYASTNKEGEILSIIKMKSIPKRSLGTEDVEILVRGVIRDHLGEYGRMQLTKGPQFVPGEYEIDFTGRKLHFLNRKFKFLNDISFFKKLNTTYQYNTSALIYAGTPREFEKKLLEYKETIVNEKLKPFNEKLERIQTLGSMLNKTMEDYLLALGQMKKPKDASLFEKQYMKEVSPIVQSLVVAANEIAKKSEAFDESPASSIGSYKNQVQLGKQLGEMASDMITETAKQKKLTEVEKKALHAKFETRYKFIKAQIDSNITRLQAEIDKISN